MNGPVVEAARAALESHNVDLVLPFAPASAAHEIRSAFERARAVIRCGPAAKDVGERWFFETVVRLHLSGEGKPFEGLKPASPPVPIIKLAEQAVEVGDCSAVRDALYEGLTAALEERFDRAMRLKPKAAADVASARSYTTSMLAFIVWTHHMFDAFQRGESHAAPTDRSRLVH